MSFPLKSTDRYGTRANQFNVVHAEVPLKCEAIRIQMTPKEDACVGILEVKVDFAKPQGKFGERRP